MSTDLTFAEVLSLVSTKSNGHFCDNYFFANVMLSKA